jgi:hypothetical protein
MRIRSIKPELWTDARTGEWDARLTLFFVGLWQVADDAGRLRLDSRLIRADLDPFDSKFGGTEGIEALLAQLVRQDRLLPYEHDGERLALIANFARHQKINRPTPSRLPAPPMKSMDPSVRAHGGLTTGREQGSGSRDQGAGSLLARAGDPSGSASPVDDLPPRPPPPFVDTCELPEDAATVRAHLERARRKTLAKAGAEDFAAQVARLGQDEALRVCVEAWEEYQKRTGEAPGSLAWFAGAMAKYLGAPPPATGPCPTWDRLLAFVRGLPAAQRPSDDSLRAWLEPLRPWMNDGVLVLSSPTPDHAAYVQANVLPGLLELAPRALGGALRITVEAPPRAAVGTA